MDANDSKLVILQYTAVITASLSSTGYGAILSWTSPALSYLTSDKAQSQLNAKQFDLISPLANAGLFCEFILNPFIFHKLGSKWSMLLYAIPQIISWLLLVESEMLTIICLSRFITGVAYGGAVCVSIEYILAISNFGNRGILFTMNNLMFAFGSLLPTLYGAYLSYHHMNIALMITPIVFFIIFIFLPDISFFFEMNRRKEAMINLQTKGSNGPTFSSKEAIDFKDESVVAGTKFSSKSDVNFRDETKEIRNAENTGSKSGGSTKKSEETDAKNAESSSTKYAKETEPKNAESTCSKNAEGTDAINTENTGFRSAKSTKNAKETSAKSAENIGTKNAKETGPKNAESTYTKNAEDTDAKNAESTGSKIAKSTKNTEETDAKNAESTSAKNSRETEAKNSPSTEESRSIIQKFNIRETNLWKLITLPNNRRAIMIMICLSGVDILAGHIPTAAYTQQFLTHRGAIMAPDKASLLLSALRILGILLSTQIVERIGKRNLILYCGIIASLSMVLVGCFFFLLIKKYDISSIGWFPIVFLIISETSNAIGVGNTFYNLQAELFDNEVKSVGISLTSCFYVILSFLSLIKFQAIMELVGMHVIFWFFSIISALLSSIIFVICPETKGKSVEEIQEELKKMT